MLIRFNVGNFLSFSENESGLSEEFSMISNKNIKNKKRHIFDNDEIQLLKFAALYGKDARSLKNLLKAMKFMKDTILNDLPADCKEMYCKTDESNKTKPSYFEMEIMINHKYYAYGFQMILNQRKFVSEWLVELNSDGSEKIIYERGFSDLDNKLLLPSVKEKVMKDVYQWIKEDFVIYPSNLNNKLDDLIMNEEKTYVASFDNCKDQNEIYTFVQEYLKFAEKRKIQLIVTTNATNLMDLKLLRRDEIWFISRRRTKNHSIYSLDEFDDRFDKNLEIAYLDGRFNVI